MEFKFKSELEKDLLEFMKVANEQKEVNKFCDLNKHKIWSKIIPMDEELERKANEIPVISLIESDEELDPKNTSKISVSDKKVETQTSMHSDEEYQIELSNLVGEFNNINDLASAIKENLETHQIISDNVINDLKSQQSNVENLEQMFNILIKNLNVEEVYNLGLCIQNEFSVTSNANLFYLKYLLLPTLKSGFWDNLGNLVDNYINRNPLDLKNEIVNEIIQRPNLSILQYVKHFNNFKSEILKDYVNDLGKIDEIQLQIIENLLNNSCEEEILKKILAKLSECCENYTEDKAFGKIVTNILQFLNRNCMELENAIRRIVNCHKSIWKSKILKHFENHFQDSMTFTAFTQSYSYY